MKSIITTSELLRLTKDNDKNVRIVDTRPFNEYVQGHIHNSVNIELMQFHWSDTTRSGIKEFNKQMSNLLSNLGIKKKTYLIFYDNISGPSAARGVWLSLYFSHRKVAMLDGGFTLWKKEKRSIETGSNHLAYNKFNGKPNSRILSDARYITKHIKKNKNVQIIDARSREEYLGTHVRACRGGHIPKAKNIDWNGNISNGKFKEIKELAELYSGFAKNRDITVYCQGGYRAANTFVILRELGFKKARMYLGSWNEWGNIPKLPIETG